MSPLGSYPRETIVSEDAAFVVNSDLSFSIVRIVEEDWGFSEVDSLSPLDIPLLGALLLSGAGYPYPFGGVELEAEYRKPLDADCIAECRHHLLEHINAQHSHAPRAAVVHTPPINGGRPYETYDFGDARGKVIACTGGWPTSPACKFTPAYLWNADREITGGAPLLALFEKGPLGRRTQLS